ncbi:hypothetical protein O7626_09335 [Micromonospora sp. WMMD1102]|uniref:hypothetical protein n=1 Tax=Micromonospora sp. WMMD1102 TaxID=3016105 RepID=UPI0024155F46|nr:hypothetical protein [Micromonospora sp. WMMD1102]MDG4786126.1 hypothetical protein [Micromonospora sp. WMMD1102]
MRKPQPAPEIALVAVADDDTFAHAYPDVPTLLCDPVVTGAHRDELEFFDAEGRRLNPVTGPTGELTGLRAGAGEPDPDALRHRLARVVRHVETHLRARPELVERFGIAPEAAIAALPDPERLSLAETLAVLPHQDRPEVRRTAWWQPDVPAYAHSDGWFHNAMHAAGWTHP